MGHGTYDCSTRSVRATASGYYTKSAGEIFDARTVNSAMSPFGVALRESRDSDEHPDSLAIVIGLDMTGSMGSIPHHLVKDGLPDIIGRIQQRGIKDPQLLFVGVGDHECDRVPLQVGQFESSDELMDKWLTSIFLEGGGGGNDGESYLLAWYFAGHRTATDCFDKRKRKGFLFTIGDEPTLKDVPKRSIAGIMGEGQYEDFTSAGLLAKAMERYHVYHVHVSETSAGSRKATVDGWKQLLGNNLIVARRHEEIPNLIADKIVEVALADAGKGSGQSVKKTDGEKPLEIIL